MLAIDLHLEYITVDYNLKRYPVRDWMNAYKKNMFVTVNAVYIYIYIHIIIYRVQSTRTHLSS